MFWKLLGSAALIGIGFFTGVYAKKKDLVDFEVKGFDDDDDFDYFVGEIKSKTEDNKTETKNEED